MQGVTGNLPDRPFLCVVAAEYPIYCDKCFPNIEKHNEHVKRFHSPIFWCDKCLHKFSSSLTNRALNLDKTDHEKNHCTGEPSARNRKIRDRAWIMDQDQYHRFKEVGWKKTDVPKRICPNGKPESLSERSWRQIRQTIFPYSEEMTFLNSEETTSPNPTGTIFPSLEESAIELTNPPALYRSTEDVMTIVARRRSTIMPQLTDVPALSRDVRQRSTLMPVPPSMTTDTQLSTQYSWETDSQTHPSSYVFSHSGGDGYQRPDDLGFGKPTDIRSSFSQTQGMSQGQQSSESWMSGTGAWSGPLPKQTPTNYGHHIPRKATDQE